MTRRTERTIDAWLSLFSWWGGVAIWESGMPDTGKLMAFTGGILFFLTVFTGSRNEARGHDA